MKTKTYNGIEFETEVRHFNKPYSEWKEEIPKGWRLMTLEDVNKLSEEEIDNLEIGNSTEYIKQLFKIYEKDYPLSSLDSNEDSDRLCVDGDDWYWDDGYDGYAFGVRFVREVEEWS